MNNLKLGVDVASAHNLLPKDGQGSSSAYVELYFDGQRYRTTIKEKDLSPVWDESFYFNISDPSNLQNLTLEAYIYNNIKDAQSHLFLGKVSITSVPPVDYALKETSPFLGGGQVVGGRIIHTDKAACTDDLVEKMHFLFASVLEVVVKDKDLLKDDFGGLVRFDLNEVPIRVPPDSPLAPEWYRLRD
ncbi:hypothetical protein AgCh_033706 [Apium graveolens]